MKLPRLSGRELIKILSKCGFSISRQKGSHVILVKVLRNSKIISGTPKISSKKFLMESKAGKKGVVVPNHQEIDKGTLLEIIRQAGLTREEFLKLIK